MNITNDKEHLYADKESIMKSQSSIMEIDKTGFKNMPKKSFDLVSLDKTPKDELQINFEDEILEKTYIVRTASYFKNVIHAPLKPIIRQQWSSYTRYVFCLLAISFNFESGYFFPFQLLENGGIVFLFCVIVLILLYGAPLIFLEIYLGQFSGKGVSRCWHFAPIIKGMGLCMMIFNFLYLTHQNFVAGLLLFYMSNSLQTHMPWYYCLNMFNDGKCQDAEIYNKKSKDVESSLDQFWYIHINGIKLVNQTAENFYQFDTNLKVMAYTVFMIVAFILVFFYWNLISPVVYPLVIYPFSCSVILVLLGFTLTGNVTNILTFLTPNFSKLLSPATWLAAMELVIYSFGLGYGTLITMSSYNSIQSNIVYSVLILIGVCLFYFCLQSILSLQTFHFIMKKHFLTLDDLKCYKGLNLIFVGVPEMLGQLDWSNLWTFTYFSSLLILALGRTFASMEVLLCGIFDKYPIFLSNDALKLLAFIFFFIFEHFIGLIYFSFKGFYFYLLISTYLNGYITLFFCLWECIFVCYIYKFKNFSEDYKIITGKVLNQWWKIIFLLIIPAICILGIVMRFHYVWNVSFYYIWTEITLSNLANTYGHIGSVCILMPIPLYAIFYFYESIFRQNLSIKETLINSVTPTAAWGNQL